LAQHGLDFAALTQAFFEEAVIYPGKQGRLRAVGNLKRGTPWTVVFALLGNEAVSVVSMRQASKKGEKMPAQKLHEGFTPGRGYTKEDWDEVSDNPELTDEELAQGKPFAEMFPGVTLVNASDAHPQDLSDLLPTPSSPKILTTSR